MAQRGQTDPGSTRINSKIIKGIIDSGRIETEGEENAIVPSDRKKQLENLEDVGDRNNHAMVPEQRISTKVLRQKLPSVYKMYKFLREDEQIYLPKWKGRKRRPKWVSEKD